MSGKRTTEKSMVLTLGEVTEKGLLGIIQYLVEVQHEDIHIKDSEGRNLLHIAAFHGHLESVKYLIGCGIDVNDKDNLAHSPLQKAAINGHLNILRYLLSQGAHVKDIDEISKDLLKDAVEKGRLEMLQYLIGERKIDINSDDLGWRLIEHAAFSGQLAIMKYLFYYQTNWKSDERLDLDFLNRIALEGHFSVMQYLSETKPIPLPPLWEAIEKNYLGIVKYLIEIEEKDGNKRDSQDWSPSSNAAYGNRLARADGNNLRYKTPLDLAIEQGHLSQVSRYAHEKFWPSCPRNLFALRD